MTTYEQHRKLTHDIMERNEQKLNPPRYEEELVNTYRPNIWMEQMDRTTVPNNKRDLLIAAIVLLLCIIIYSLAPGFTFEDIFVKGGVK